ncbi:MAG: hypothetical protein JKY56_14495 [Kofleriaceae bacterium]|nr:hypothetical protein [Kofleriaceae bacterium]
MGMLSNSPGLLVLPLAAIFACSGGSGGDTADAAVDAMPLPDAFILPAFFTPQDNLSDDELATQALALINGDETGAGATTCTACHGITKQRLFHWRALADTTMSECLTDLTVPNQTVALEMLNCLRQDPTDPTSAFSPEKASIFSTGANLRWFEYAFRTAYGEGFQTEYDQFIDRVAMPKGTMTPYSQTEFDVLASWFTRGLPLLDEKLPEDPPPTECTPGVSAAVATHVADTTLNGWRAVNKQNGILMFGCDPKSDNVFDCLSSYEQAGDEKYSKDWAANVQDQQIRILRQNNYISDFWTRSSADGRYVGHGAQTGGARSRIVDLQRDLAIPGTAFYDPSFFPDNSGFMFQTSRAYMCNQSLLATTESITYNQESECTISNEIGLYQHVGANVSSGDYWAVAGQFVSDGGHGRVLSDPDAGFSGGSRVKFTPFIHDGTSYSAGEEHPIDIPFEGDTIISASSKMILSRLRGPGDNQLGFVMREVTTTETQAGYDIELNEVARYCFNGGKPAFSYDDRWLVLHHYIGNADAVDLGYTSFSDPEFESYRNNGSANIYLIDTLTGQVTRITKMRAGEYALFPHFRSDGWIYFMVRNLGSGSERIVASDAALRLEAASQN